MSFHFGGRGPGHLVRSPLTGFVGTLGDLGTLSLSATTFTRGASTSGTILGATALSTITASGLPSGLTIDGTARTWAWDGTGSGASSGNVTLTEALAGHSNTPHDTIIGYTIIAAANLTISTAPTLSGAAIVGQTIFVTNGTYSATPDTITPTWTLDGATLSDETGDSVLLVDSYVGSVIGYSEIAHKAGYTDSSANPATSTSAIADIDLSADSPANTRTSGNTVVPMTWDTVFGTKTFSNYLVRLQEGSDVGFSTIVQEVTHVLTEADLVPGATIPWAAEGLSAIGVNHFIRERIETATTSGVFKSSGWSNVIGPTNYVGDAVTDNFDDNVVDLAIWHQTASEIPSNFTAGAATIAETSGATVITPDPTAASNAGRRTKNSAAFVGKFAAIRLPADFDVVQQEAFIHVGPAANQGYQAIVSGNGGSSSVQLHGLNAGADTNINGASPFFGTYRWIVLRDDGAGNIKIDAMAGASVPGSFTGGTNLVTFPKGGWPYWNSTDPCYVWIGGGGWGANASITPVALEDFNTNMAI